MRYRTIQRMVLGISITLLLALAAIVVIPGKSQQQEPSRKAQGRRLDENRFPIADYGAPEPSDPAERAKRHAKGQKYDKSPWNIYPDAQSSMARTHSIDPDLAALPIAESTAVIIAEVKNARAYLSNDKTGVYSVFNVQVDEVIKNSSTSSLTTASLIEVERDGGRVRFPNGRILTYVSTNMPQAGLRYVLFLKIPQGHSDFQILTGYELRDSKVYPLDDLPNSLSYENTEEAIFLNQLRTKAAELNVR
jgi:sRNA-binding protein